MRSIIVSTTMRVLTAAALMQLMWAMQLAWAQPLLDPTASTTTETIEGERESASAIAARRAELNDTLESLSSRSDAMPAHLEALRARWRQVDSRLVLQASLAERLGSAAPEPDEDRPVRPPSVSALAELLEERASVEARAARHGQMVDAAHEALADAKARLTEAAAQRRRVAVELESAASGERKAMRAAVELAQVEERLAKEDVSLRKLEMRVAKSASSAAGALERVDGEIAAMRAAIASGEAPPDLPGAELDASEARLRRARDEVGRRLAGAELRLAAAQSRFAKGPSPTTRLVDGVAALRSVRDLTSQEAEILDQRIERIATRRELLRRWDALLRGAPPLGDVGVWETELVDQIESLRRDELRRGWQVADLDARIADVRRRRAAVQAGDELGPVLDLELEALAALRTVLADDLESLAADRSVGRHVLAEIEDRTGRLSPVELLSTWLRALRALWSSELTSVDDSPITVGSLVIALLIFATGLWLSRHGAAAVARVFGARLSLDTGATQAIETLTFYLLLVVLSVLALRAIHFPLAALTVIGGTLAIGIGFGSQNVMNNFISGLILMLERPVRTHDLIEVDGNHGTIERIGTRSTQIRSTDGRHIIVPNSFFLENNVVNWTLSDDLLRTKVSVGVIYGSPTRLVESLIRQVVDDEPRALAEPEPVIIFDEFGDNSLNFDLYFWIRARTPMGTRLVESRIRFAIDDAFREHGLVIAFPQRDVHLDAASPLEVRVLREGDETSG